jgi:hypothetical protein
MADDSISREKLYDARIAQPPSRFAVNVGGSAITVTPFRAVSASAGQLTFTVNVPSQTVFLDRAVELAATVAYRFDVRCYNAQPVAAEPLFIFGRDGALEALPVHSLISTLTVVLNDSSVTVDLGSTMKELLRLTDYAANRKIRTAPTMLDRYAQNASSANATNSPLNGYESAVTDAEVPNGAWWDIVYADPASGATLAGNGTYTNPGSGGLGPAATISYIDGVPQRYASGTQAEAALYAANGYLVLHPNPRGSTGYGQDFCLAIWRDWGGPDYADVMAAVDDAIARGWADPKRLGVTGWSYGGMLTNHVITVTVSKRLLSQVKTRVFIAPEVTKAVKPFNPIGFEVYNGR